MKNFLRLSLASVATLMASVPALAEGGDAGNRGWYALASGIAIGVAAIGGALGQGKAVSSALDGIARNPAATDKIFTPMILGLALIESLVIFAFVISFLLQSFATK